MARGDIHVGVEIGTSKIAVVVGEVRADAPIKILGTSTAPSRGVRKGEITDMRQVQTALHDALYRAEESCDVRIVSILLSVTGSHLQSLNHQGTILLPEEQSEITQHDLNEVRRVAQDVAIPRGNRFLHGVLQYFSVDDVEKVVDPVGRIASKLEASYHIVHANTNRVMNSVNCVRELSIEIRSVVFAPLATALVTLNREQRDRGAILIDIGGGTSDYAVYREGVLVQSGCLPIGGDHITNDIATCLNLPLAKALQLKTNEGCAVAGDPELTETISLEGDPQFMGCTVEREELDGIINARVEEIFELIVERIEMGGGLSDIGAGVFLSGGTSQLLGIDRAAAGIFNLPVHITQGEYGSGQHVAFEDPAFRTAVGLIRFAQIEDMEKPRSRGILGFFSRCFSYVRSVL